MGTTEFITEAYFYAGEEGALCRKYLTMRRPDAQADKPELIFLLLNPGNCGEGQSIQLDSVNLVKPDPTLYRIQQLMLERKIGCVRVVNLYDRKDVRGDKIVRELSEAAQSFPTDSIFSRDLSEVLAPDIPIFIAWGAVAQRLPLAQEAIAVLRERGYRIVNEKDVHWHPLVRPGGANGQRPLWRNYAERKLEISRLKRR